MILLCGIPSEAPLALAIEAAQQLAIPHVVFNQRHAAHYALRLRVREGEVRGELEIDGNRYALESFAGVYPRMSDPNDLPSARTNPRHGHAERLAAQGRWVHTILFEWLELATCRVANRASAMASNGSKPYQAQLIARTGFRVPSTLISNDLAALRTFHARHGELIYKSSSSVRSIVRPLDLHEHARLRRLRALPTQFQRRILGTNVRVHVVGDELFATEIASSAVDYRYDGEGETDMHAIELPAPVAQRCRVLSRALELPFCGIDLMRDKDGEYTCFEVNPSPAYSCYQQTTGQPIAQALVRYLAAEAQDADHRELDRAGGARHAFA